MAGALAPAADGGAQIGWPGRRAPSRRACHPVCPPIHLVYTSSSQPLVLSSPTSSLNLLSPHLRLHSQPPVSSSSPFLSSSRPPRPLSTSRLLILSFSRNLSSPRPFILCPTSLSSRVSHCLRQHALAVSPAPSCPPLHPRAPVPPAQPSRAHHCTVLPQSPLPQSRHPAPVLCTLLPQSPCPNRFLARNLIRRRRAPYLGALVCWVLSMLAPRCSVCWLRTQVLCMLAHSACWVTCTLYVASRSIPRCSCMHVYRGARSRVPSASVSREALAQVWRRRGVGVTSKARARKWNTAEEAC